MKPFEEYVRLLLELHTLMEAGKGDTEEADAVRDKMDGPWRSLSAHEVRVSDLVSDALYGPEGKRSTLPAFLAMGDLLHVCSAVRKLDENSYEEFVLGVLAEAEGQRVGPALSQILRGLAELRLA